MSELEKKAMASYRVWIERALTGAAAELQRRAGELHLVAAALRKKKPLGDQAQG